MFCQFRQDLLLRLRAQFDQNARNRGLRMMRRTALETALRLMAIALAAPAGISALLSTGAYAIDSQDGVFRPQDFGATCDGKTDDTEAFRHFTEAMRKSASRAVKGSISGRCKITGPVNFKPNPGTILEGEGADAAILCAGTAPGWCLTIFGGGTAGSKVSIRGNSAKDAKQVSVDDASTLQPGDYVFIAYVDATDPNKFSQGELNQLTGKDGNLVQLAYPVTFPIMLTNHRATIQKLTLTKGVTIRNLTIDGSLSTGASWGLNITNFAGATVSHIFIRNFMSRSAQQSGLNIGNCDGCRIDHARAERINGHAMNFLGLVNSTVSAITVKNLVGVPIEYTWSSKSNVSNVVVELAPSSEARAFKITGSTENVFRNIDLSGGKIHTGFSLTSGTSYNKIYGLVSRKSSSCIWLNGTANNHNFFDGITTEDCNYRGTKAVAAYVGYSITIGATAPYTDVGNRFVNVDIGSKPHLHIVGAGNTISYRAPARPSSTR